MVGCVKQIHCVTHLELYGRLPRVSTKIRARRLRQVNVSDMLSWQRASLCFGPLTQGHCSRGRPQTTYVDTLCRDSGLRREELRTAMEDQRVWRAIIRCSDSTCFKDTSVTAWDYFYDFSHVGKIGNSS